MRSKQNKPILQRRPAAKKAIAIDHSRNTWTPAMAAAWAGIPTRTLYRLLRAGNVPSIPIGESQSQEWSNSHTGTRERACFRYMIPRAAFIRYWENIGSTTPINYADSKAPLNAA